MGEWTVGTTNHDALEAEREKGKQALALARGALDAAEKALDASAPAPTPPEPESPNNAPPERISENEVGEGTAVEAVPPPLSYDVATSGPDGPAVVPVEQAIKCPPHRHTYLVCPSCGAEHLSPIVKCQDCDQVING